MKYRAGLVLVIGACAGCGRIGFEPVDEDLGAANLIFATSALHRGDVGGVTAADAICNTEATAAGHAGTFIAWMSGASFGRIDGSRGWRRGDGVAIADLPSDFMSRRLLAPITTDALGQALPETSPWIWTGIANDGSTPFDCAQWTSASSTVRGIVGTIFGGGERFTEAASINCDTPAHLLCLEIGQVTPVHVSRVAGRIAFVSSLQWVPSGVASADATCQLDARQAGLPGTYLAALPTTTQPTTARFDLSGPAWVRTDGAPLSATASELFTAPILETFINRRADRSIAPRGAQWWGGDPSVVPTTNTCQDWTSNASGVAIRGLADAVDRQARFGVGSISCNLPLSLLCLQQ